VKEVKSTGQKNPNPIAAKPAQAGAMGRAERIAGPERN